MLKRALIFVAQTVDTMPTGSFAISALWILPAAIASVWLIAWTGEAAQFLISQGLALAILVSLEPLPAFASKSVIAWQAGKDPEKFHLVTANFTGSLRVFVALNSPMIFAMAAYFTRAVELAALALAILYFVFILCKATRTIPRDSGLILYLVSHSFLDSMLAQAVCAGVSQFVFLLWIAPLPSRLSGKVRALYCAGKIHSGMIVPINWIFSNIKQWMMLMALFPIVFGVGCGRISPIRSEEDRKRENLTTLVPSLLRMILLREPAFAVLRGAGTVRAFGY